MGNSSAPLKRSGWSFGIYEQKASLGAGERCGMLRNTANGLKFRLAKASEALSVAKMTLATQSDAAHLDEAITAAVAIGETQLALTVTAGTAIVANQLAGGFFEINSGTGAGYRYPIVGNTAISASGTSIYISLDRPIAVALDTTSTFNLLHSLWYNAQLTSTDENVPTGIPLIDVTSGYYCWLQTGGEATCLIAGSCAVGDNLIVSATEGAVTLIASSVDQDVPIVGYMSHVATAASDYGPIFLTID
jgi:hypothetical protein